MNSGNFRYKSTRVQNGRAADEIRACVLPSYVGAAHRPVEQLPLDHRDDATFHCTTDLADSQQPK